MILKPLSSSATTFDVAIIGAGMAGLRAAQVLRQEHLQQQKHNNNDNARRQLRVVILEGRNVAGGRIRWTRLPATNKDDSTKLLYIDEGAQFIHGVSKKHPIVKLAQQSKVLYRKMDWDDGYFLVGPNQQELPRKLQRKEEHTVEKIKRQLSKWQKQQAKKSSSDDDDDDESLYNILEMFIQQVCQDDANLSAQRLWTHFRAEVQDEYGADLKELSARYFDQDDEFSETDAVPHNYSKIVEAMLPPTKQDDSSISTIIRYQHAVEQVTFPSLQVDDDGLVRIQCRRMDDGAEETDQIVEIQAERLICTLPLGVLKQQVSTSFFQPALPVTLQESIQRLGYACFEKLFLTFTVPPFWPTDADAFYHGASDTPFRVWFLPARVYRNTAYERTLCCFLSASPARAMAKCTEEEVAARALEALSQILPIPNQNNSAEEPLIQNVHLTRWSTDRWSGEGSYSHIALGSTAADYRTFEHSYYEDRLWFAGEATNAQYPQTVHGAYLSGERAAKACYKVLSSS